MLTSTETKTVLSTLTQRRAYLRKMLEESKLDNDARKEYSQTIQLLDSSMKKLVALQSKNVPNSSNQKTANQPSAKRRSITPENTKILVADDQAATREMIVQILTDLGIGIIECAADGRETFDQIKNASPPYDIVLCDWEMPELNGLEVLGKAKASNTLGQTLFWMVTANTDPKKIKEAAASGIHDYIAKPVDQKILEDKLKAAIIAKGGSLDSS